MSLPPTEAFSWSNGTPARQAGCVQRHHGATLSCPVVAAEPMAIDVVAQNTTHKNDTHDCDEVLRIVLVARPMWPLSHATERDPWRGNITSSQQDRGASFTRVMRTTSRCTQHFYYLVLASNFPRRTLIGEKGVHCLAGSRFSRPGNRSKTTQHARDEYR
jgi:hypothetical protein